MSDRNNDERQKTSSLNRDGNTSLIVLIKLYNLENWRSGVGSEASNNVRTKY